MGGMHGGHAVGWVAVMTFFEPELIDGADPGVARYFRAAIAPGAPLVNKAHLRMHGHIKMGRWVPFTADEILEPREGFLWRARVARGLISGSDRYLDGLGAMRWKVLGVLPLMRNSGPDLARSAAGRAGGEAIWLPTAVLPDGEVRWRDEDQGVTVDFAVDDVPVTMHLTLDEEGRVRSFELDRWGDPGGTGTWSWHRFGGDVSEHRTFAGLTIPSAGSVGWHHGTDRWNDGEFFRYQITDLVAVA